MDPTSMPQSYTYTGQLGELIHDIALDGCPIEQTLGLVALGTISVAKIHFEARKADYDIHNDDSLIPRARIHIIQRLAQDMITDLKRSYSKETGYAKMIHAVKEGNFEAFFHKRKIKYGPWREKYPGDAFFEFDKYISYMRIRIAAANIIRQNYILPPLGK